MTKTTLARIAAVGAMAMLLSAGLATAKSHGKGPHGHGARGPSGHGDGGDGGHPGKGGGGTPCDPTAMASLDASVDAACPCAGADDGQGGTIPWKNHGQYVRCVVHALRAARATAGVAHRCLHDLVPCAAHSACGKRDAVACVVTTAGSCAGGSCTNDSTMACTSDADCAATTCTVTRSATCAASGGTPGTGSCCFGSPGGAFVE